MYDVNPLGPMMHLKQIERDAFALRTSMARDSLRAARGWTFSGFLKRLLISPTREVGVVDRLNPGRQ